MVDMYVRDQNMADARLFPKREGGADRAGVQQDRLINQESTGAVVRQ